MEKKEKELPSGMSISEEESSSARKSISREESSPQMSIFDPPIDIPRGDPGEMKVGSALRGELTRALSICGLSRYQVAGKMSELLDQEITKAMLDAWTADSKQKHRFPGEFLSAFCFAVHCYEPLKLLARRCGCEVLETKEAAWAALARLEKEKAALNRKEQELRRMVDRPE